MANKKTTKTKKKSSLKKSSTSASAGNRSQVISFRPNLIRMNRKVCSISDPFCDAAIGSKWADSAANKTMPFASRSMDSIVSGANGSGALLIIPGYHAQISRPTAAGAGSATFVNTSSIIPSGFMPSQYRIVSWGFTLKNLTAPLYSSGMVRIRGLSNSGASLNILNSTLYNDFHYDIPLQDCKEVAVIGRRLDESFHFFRTPNTTNPDGFDGLVANWVPPGWSPIFIFLEGVPPSVSVLQIEYFFNYELMFTDGDAMANVTTPSPAASPLLATASSHVTKMAGNVFTRGVRQVETAVMKFATQYLASAIGGAISGPLGAIAGGTSQALLMNAMEVD